MITTISKWGNSQGVRLANSILEASGYSMGDEVEVSVVGNGILIQKKMKKPKNLKAAGMLRKYVTRHVSDEEMKDAWADAIAENWNEKNC